MATAAALMAAALVLVAAIVVEMGRETTPGHQESAYRPGVLLWKLVLAAHEKRDVVLAYSVRFPKDLPVSGLD